MPRLSRRLSSSARKAALAFRTRVSSLNLTGIRPGTLGRSWSWRSNANTSSNASASSTTHSSSPPSSTSAGVTSDTATVDQHVRNASVPLDHHNVDDVDELSRHARWASAPTEMSPGSTTSLDRLGGDHFGTSGIHHLNGDGDDSATVVDLARDADAQTLTPPPHPTRPAPRPPTPHHVLESLAADDSALSPLDIDSNMFASFTTVVGGESSTASSAAALAAEPHHPRPNSHRRYHHPHHTHHSHYEIHDPIPTPATTNVSTSSLALGPQTRDSSSSLLAPSLVTGEAAAQHMCVPSTLSSFSDPRQPDDSILHNPHRCLLSPSDFDATLESTMIPGLDLATVSPLALNEDAMSTTSTVIRTYTPPPLAAASSSSAAAAGAQYHHPAPPSGTHLPIATHAQLPSSPQPTVPRRRSLSASTLDRIPTFGRRSSSAGSTSSSSLAAHMRPPIPDPSQPADRASVSTTRSSEGTVLAQGRASPAGTLDTIRTADAHVQRRPEGVADYYESQLARLAFEYHEELARAQVEREALVAELARVRAQAAAAASDRVPSKPAAHANLSAGAADVRQHLHGRADTSDSDDVAANTTVSSIASDTASARTAGTSGTAKKKRVSFDSETLLAQLESSQLARQRADNTIRRLQEQLELVAGSTGRAGPAEAYFPVSAREFKLIRDSAADVEMLAHAVQARVRRFEADRGADVGGESGSDSESKAGEQVKTRLGEEDKWERVVALVAHVVKGTEVIVREASAIFDWAASAGHPIASPEELSAWHADRSIVLRVMRAAQSVVDAAAVGAAKESPANMSEQQQESPAAAVVGGAVDVAAAKTVAIGACVQLAGWVQLIESAVGDITDSLSV